VVVHADVDDVAIVAMAESPVLRHWSAGKGGHKERGPAEIVIQIFALKRPPRTEHVFDAGANGPSCPPSGLSAC
jgi:hypothetical protein